MSDTEKITAESSLGEVHGVCDSLNVTDTREIHPASDVDGLHGSVEPIPDEQASSLPGHAGTSSPPSRNEDGDQLGEEVISESKELHPISPTVDYIQDGEQVHTDNTESYKDELSGFNGESQKQVDMAEGSEDAKAIVDEVLVVSEELTEQSLRERSPVEEDTYMTQRDSLVEETEASAYKDRTTPSENEANHVEETLSCETNDTDDKDKELISKEIRNDEFSPIPKKESTIGAGQSEEISENMNTPHLIQSTFDELQEELEKQLSDTEPTTNIDKFPAHALNESTDAMQEMPEDGLYEVDQGDRAVPYSTVPILLDKETEEVSEMRKSEEDASIIDQTRMEFQEDENKVCPISGGMEEIIDELHQDSSEAHMGPDELFEERTSEEYVAQHEMVDQESAQVSDDFYRDKQQEQATNLADFESKPSIRIEYEIDQTNSEVALSDEALEQPEEVTEPPEKLVEAVFIKEDHPTKLNMPEDESEDQVETKGSADVSYSTKIVRDLDEATAEEELIEEERIDDASSKLTPSNVETLEEFAEVIEPVKTDQMESELMKPKAEVEEIVEVEQLEPSQVFPKVALIPEIDLTKIESGSEPNQSESHLEDTVHEVAPIMPDTSALIVPDKELENTTDITCSLEEPEVNTQQYEVTQTVVTPNEVENESSLALVDETSEEAEKQVRRDISPEIPLTFATQISSSSQLEVVEEFASTPKNLEFVNPEHVIDEKNQYELEQQHPQELGSNGSIKFDSARDQPLCFTQALESKQNGEQRIEPLEDAFVKPVEPSEWTVDDITHVVDVHKTRDDLVEQRLYTTNLPEFTHTTEQAQSVIGDSGQETTEVKSVPEHTMTMNSQPMLYATEERDFAVFEREEPFKQTEVPIKPATTTHVNSTVPDEFEQDQLDSMVDDTGISEKQAAMLVSVAREQADLLNAYNPDDALSSDKENADQVELKERYAQLIARYEPKDMGAEKRKQRSKTLESNFDINQLRNWNEPSVEVKRKSATLGRSGSRRRHRPLPKPAINDDHLFPDSVTPSKVDRNLSTRSLSVGLPEGTYDVPYIDDDAFIPRKLRDKPERDPNEENGGDLSTESDEYLWDPSLSRYSALDPSHRADIDECTTTPQIVPKTGKGGPRGKTNGERDLITGNKSKGSKKRRLLGLCSCVGLRSRK